ncbi:MAG: hypothetical protein JNK05_10615 [Myxococcales bacterium]|nr:hypothetical protein [Myxococcales bacterium]
MRSGGLIIALALMVLVSVGCDRPQDETPEDALSAWVAAMNGSRGDPSTRRRAYDLLSQRTRENLARRAAVAAQLSGREVKAWEMLAPGRFALRFSFDRQALRARVEGDRAVVIARGPRTEVAEVPMVREEGRWRVDLALPEPAGPLRLQGSPTEPRTLAR